MKVKCVLPSSDERDFDLLITDGINDIICNAVDYNSNKTFCLLAFITSEIFISDSNEYRIIKESSYYAYSFIGSVENISNNRLIIRVFGLLIEIDDDFPSDLSIGDYIHFRVQRIDYYEK